MATHHAGATATLRGADTRDFGDLLGRLANDILRLLDQKLALLKVELKEELSAAVRRSALLAVGGVVAAIGAFFLLVALALGVGDLVGSTSGGFAIVGGVFAVVGLVLLSIMRRRLAGQRFVPELTVRELRRDKQWIKHEL
jgi:uncharacterized membrane protein YqjE